jgi:hypothetical protein
MWDDILTSQGQPTITAGMYKISKAAWAIFSPALVVESIGPDTRIDIPQGSKAWSIKNCFVTCKKYSGLVSARKTR